MRINETGAGAAEQRGKRAVRGLVTLAQSCDQTVVTLQKLLSPLFSISPFHPLLFYSSNAPHYFSTSYPF